MRFAWGFDEEAAECHDMKMELAQQIMVLRQQGVTHFSVACDYGVGLYAAEMRGPELKVPSRFMRKFNCSLRLNEVSRQ